ncbi:alpha-(1,6)-fucosyltransferase-like [Oppia nitens]|uniref:alpha-(1,6)-fucosyltransferase-like n=1 Tax=Oppia nitens TaxID=1686743 RepID=UPI0023DB5D31|nr:alpha-(1,6)-fucosyltransferase-like [Oppia nitens]
MFFTPFWRSLKSRSLFILVSLSWLALIIFIFTVSSVYQRVPYETSITPEVDAKYIKLNERLNDANQQIETLMSQNRELAQNLKKLSEFKSQMKKEMIDKKLREVNRESSMINVTKPNTQYELAFRRIRQNTDELWHFLRKRVPNKYMSFIDELRYNMYYDLNVIADRDNHWRRNERKNLSDYVQKAIYRLQNPRDCDKAKKLICDLNKYCGFGCQIHHLAHCFVAAMALNRTLIAETSGWRTASVNKNVWNKLFQPFSQTCSSPDGHNRTDWGSGDQLDTYQVLYYPIIDYISPIPEFLPLVIPEQIADVVIRQSGEPFIWFIGQVLNYIMRPSNKMTEYLHKFKRDNSIAHPIVGLHVRRTDKIGTEAKMHSLDEYMYFVDDYYNKLDVRNARKGVDKKVERLVYLATDEPEVWKKEIMPYKESGYVFKGDVRLSETADPSQRHEFESLHNVVVDILLLSQCDFIVCTFSSQICRLAFELMQTRDTEQDMSTAFYSIDDIYYFGGQVFHGKKAIISHKAHNSQEISFKIGDILGIANNQHNGYNDGDHNRTKHKGLYPRFKVTEFIETKPFGVF